MFGQHGDGEQCVCGEHRMLKRPVPSRGVNRISEQPALFPCEREIRNKQAVCCWHELPLPHSADLRSD